MPPNLPSHVLLSLLPIIDIQPKVNEQGLQDRILAQQFVYQGQLALEKLLNCLATITPRNFGRLRLPLERLGQSKEVPQAPGVALDVSRRRVPAMNLEKWKKRVNSPISAPMSGTCTVFPRIFTSRGETTKLLKRKFATVLPTAASGTTGAWPLAGSSRRSRPNSLTGQSPISHTNLSGRRRSEKLTAPQTQPWLPRQAV